MRFLLAAVIGPLFAMSASHAASLHICPAALPMTGTHETPIVRPDGARERVFIDAASRVEGCRSIVLPVGAEDIVSLKPIANAAAPGHNVILYGAPKDGGFGIGSVDGLGAAHPPGPTVMPWRDNLLPHMQARVYGVEERVRAQLRDDALILQCDAGSRPAGVLLQGPWIMNRAGATLELTASGNGNYALQALDANAMARESPIAIGSFSAGTEKAFKFDVPVERLARNAWRAFSIDCPNQAGTLHLSAMRLAPVEGRIAGRSSWVWDARAWEERSDEVFAHAARHALETLFVSVPLQDGAVRAPERLAAFVRAAGQRGIEVWSVDGDPEMVLPREHAASAARARAYAAYNAAAAPEARLRGLQYDVEHYLLPGYELAAAEWDRRYIELAQALKQAAAGLALEFVVPFWWADKSALLHALAPLASGLTVMDYRTRREEILRFAEPFLDWGSVHGKQVRIALEAGPLGAEQQRRYTRDDSGELWLLKLDQAQVLLLLKRPLPNPAGPAWRQTAIDVIDGSATTFHSDPERLLRLLPDLERQFSAWTSFAGVALHELK